MKLTYKRYFLFHLLTVAIIFFSSFVVFGQRKDIPVRPNPPALVNDFAGLLTSQEQSQLEYKLVAFNDTTSTQIAVVVVKSLNDYDIGDMATRIMETWGIGQKGKNNGILILVKTKTKEEKGKIFITTGYGVESFVTDALSSRIVDKEILPSFKEGQYYQGLDKATSVLMSLVKGQFSVDQYMKSGKRRSNFPIGAIVIIVILIAVFFGKNSSNRNGHYSSGGGSLPFWLLMGSMMGGNRSGGFGDFSSGGGDFGSDSGGGFGGFGGGSGGGGGAGGEW